MAVLGLLSNLSVNKPTGLWEFLLGLFDFIGNYGLRIIIFTLILKFILSPLDFFQKYKMKKNQRITESLKPDMERLQKQYANDKAGLQQEQMRLQRAAGFSYFSSCLPMVITLVVFISFFAGMRNISHYEEFKQYVGVYDQYSTHYTQLTGKNLSGDEGWNQSEYDDTLFNKVINEWRDSEELSEKENTAYIQFSSLYNGSYKEMYTKLTQLSQYVRLFSLAQLTPSGSYEYTAADAELFIGGKVGGRFNINTVRASSTPAGLAAKQDIINALNLELAKDGGGIRPLYSQDDFEAVSQDFQKLEQEINLKNNVDILIGVAELDAAFVAYEYYKANENSGFLWIKSLWVSDVFWKDAVPDFGTFRTNVSKYFDVESDGDNRGGLSRDVLDSLNSERVYNKVMLKIRQDESLSGRNGYLILAVLAVGFSFLSQFVTMRQQKKSGQVAAQGGGTMKTMMLFMPVMIGAFALFYTAAFALYMITNSAMSLIINLITSAIVGGINHTKQKQNLSDSGVIKYGRKDPNDYSNKRR